MIDSLIDICRNCYGVGFTEDSKEVNSTHPAGEGRPYGCQLELEGARCDGFDEAGEGFRPYGGCLFLCVGRPYQSARLAPAGERPDHPLGSGLVIP